MQAKTEHGAEDEGRDLLRSSRKTLARNGPLMLFEALAFCILAGLFFTVISNYAEVPPRIPTHFGLSGAADRFSDKSFLFAFLGGAAFLYLALTITAFFPHRFNYIVPLRPGNAMAQARIALFLLAGTKLCVTALFAFIGHSMVQAALSRGRDLHPAPLFSLIAANAILITICIFLSRRFR